MGIHWDCRFRVVRALERTSRLAFQVKGKTRFRLLLGCVGSNLSDSKMVSIFAVILGLSAMCSTAYSAVTLSAATQKSTLDLHNSFRAQVAAGKVAGQPAAKSMPNLVWDAALANKAKAWAERCAIGHSDGMNNGLGYQWVGENMAWGTMNSDINSDASAQSVIKQGFDGWSGESKNFAFPKTCKQGQCGHYTQLVWAKSQKVGCGVAQCGSIGGWQVSGFSKFYMLVCNYGPGGNWNNEDPYERK